MSAFKVKGNFVDIENKKIFPAEVTVESGRIKSATEINEQPEGYILPGFIDSHVHVESSMLVPSEFAKLAVVHGTVATISDPHEIANVCGMEGVEYMLQNAATVPFKFYFGAPSCVPATTFETAGAVLTAEDVKQLLAKPEIKYLSEMMNFLGVLYNDADVMQKIKHAHDANKPVDGHAPGLRSEQAKKYIDAGISTDHECFTEEEASEKLKYGMKILIREGSAAKNFEALINLLHEHADNIMFCSDDKHPDSLEAGHINDLCARAVAKGHDVFNVLQAACVNPVKHYKLEVGLLKENDPADFIVINDLKNFKVKQTYINGELVAEKGKSVLNPTKANVINQFDCKHISVEDCKMPIKDFSIENVIPLIEALDGQLITNRLQIPINDFKTDNEYLHSNPEKDLLKMIVVNRYHPAPVAKGFIKNFGFKHGAIASTVAHDSHNIIAVGANDESICKAVNAVIDVKGGVSCVNEKETKILALPVAGLMSNEDGYKVAAEYTAIDTMAKSLGSKLAAPYMTLSFMALLVIPHLKLSDKGLFDGDAFKFVSREG
jgi:adenine deaminase